MGYFDKTTDNLYPEKIDKNEYLFIKLIDSLQNDKELFFKGMLHSESQFLSTIRQIQDYIPKIQNASIKEQVEKFVKSVINHKNYAIIMSRLVQNQIKNKNRERKKQNCQNAIKSIYKAMNKGDIEEAIKIYSTNHSAISDFYAKELTKLDSKIEIAKFLKNRKIRKLIHFTNIDNLQNILKMGLLPRKILEEQNIDFVYSDENRLEGRKDCVCVSVEYPNTNMFYYKQNRYGYRYVVLVLNARKILLNDLKKYYVYINAASSRAIYWLRTDELTTLKYLKNMFSKKVQDSKYIYEREDTAPNFIPTNPQAEILVNGVVDVNDIIEVHFANSEDYDIFKNTCNNDLFLDKTKFIVSNFYFNKDRNNVAWEQR